MESGFHPILSLVHETATERSLQTAATAGWQRQ